MKRAVTVAAVAGVIAITLFGVGRLWLLSSLPPLGGREPLAGLADSVIVVWDSLAVPHVRVARAPDFFAALGYLHARDRMWQMDLLRHAAEGRLGELFGERTIATDRALRQLEIARLARARLDAAGGETRRVAAAYAAGVNAWLRRGPRTLEFRLLGHAPEPWTPLHSLEIGVLQAWDLRTTGDELELAAVAARLGIERARDLLPDTMGGGGGTAFGSNSWVLAGRRTASGRPILANDPHLTLRAPSIWYLVGAHAPGYEVVGSTMPGIPVIVLGHTRRVAWGFTNAMVDDVDYVVEQLTPDSARYRTASGWAAVEVVAETLRVKGADPVAYQRRRTANGPLVSGAWDPGAHRALALRWTAQDPGADELAALLGMARAEDWRSFDAALAAFRSPQQNVVYADAAGTIAYWLAGRVPVRRGGPGPLPAPGWTGGRRWVRYLERHELPHWRDPPAGWIVTANNRLAPREYPHFISRHYDLPFRARRIAELVQADTAATTTSVSRHQLDVVDGFARAHGGLAARAALAAGRADLADRLRVWDGAMTADAVEPTVFWSWQRNLRRLTYEDQSGEYRPAGSLDRWLRVGESEWFDDVRTPERETLDTLARRAMQQALVGPRAAPWGDVHQLVMHHPLAAIPLLGRLLGFRIGPVPAAGSNYTVNNATSTADEPPFVSSYGPSMRHVVDLGDVDGGGGFILPTGQSGHPLSRHYRDQTERWLRGELWVLPLDVAKIRAIDTLVLVPETQPPRVSPGG
ncbi:MAG: penicillin acylase family protein [Gemmatimonadales bacterium]